MTRQRSEFVSSAGKAFAVLKSLSEAVQDVGGDDDYLRELETDDQLRRGVARYLIQNRRLYDLTVRYDQPFSQMVDAGSYDRVNKDINTAHFGIKGTGTWALTARLEHVSRDEDTNEILRVLSDRGLIPAPIELLLAFGATYSPANHPPIAALGSIWISPTGNRYAPVILSGPDARVLELIDLELGWRPNWRFLTIKK